MSSARYVTGVSNGTSPSSSRSTTIVEPEPLAHRGDDWLGFLPPG